MGFTPSVSVGIGTARFCARSTRSSSCTRYGPGGPSSNSPASASSSEHSVGLRRWPGPEAPGHCRLPGGAVGHAAWRRTEERLGQTAGSSRSSAPASTRGTDMPGIVGEGEPGRQVVREPAAQSAIRSAGRVSSRAAAMRRLSGMVAAQRGQSAGLLGLRLDPPPPRVLTSSACDSSAVEGAEPVDEPAVGGDEPGEPPPAGDDHRAVGAGRQQRADLVGADHVVEHEQGSAAPCRGRRPPPAASSGVRGVPSGRAIGRTGCRRGRRP